ncbi:hypothetical protein [Cohnella nanjingensis]|uniref:Uncharacterized protein n=1 Tax=Cohnella nanjingensis TaxID=1387779 RepID=A0A7X0VG77_9BACL|nr:hypothetical protein [Cohnella nanjingensis]MBB6671364.1 hypothetical protein [Cohnella nanjingensis]
MIINVTPKGVIDLYKKLLHATAGVFAGMALVMAPFGRVVSSGLADIVDAVGLIAIVLFSVVILYKAVVVLMNKE